MPSFGEVISGVSPLQSVIDGSRSQRFVDVPTRTVAALDRTEVTVSLQCPVCGFRDSNLELQLKHVTNEAGRLWRAVGKVRDFIDDVDDNVNRPVLQEVPERNDLVLTVAQVSEILHCSTRNVRSLLSRGNIAGAHRVDSRWNIPVASLQEYLDNDPDVLLRAAERSVDTAS